MGLGLPGGVWARVWGARNCCSRTTVGNCDSTSGCCSLQAQNGGIVQGICIHKMIMVHELLFNRAKFTETFKRAKAAESRGFYCSYCIYKTTRQTEYQWGKPDINILLNYLDIRYPKLEGTFKILQFNMILEVFLKPKTVNNIIIGIFFDVKKCLSLLLKDFLKDL